MALALSALLLGDTHADEQHAVYADTSLGALAVLLIGPLVTFALCVRAWARQPVLRPAGWNVRRRTLYGLLGLAFMELLLCACVLQNMKLLVTPLWVPQVFLALVGVPWAFAVGLLRLVSRGEAGSRARSRLASILAWLCLVSPFSLLVRDTDQVLVFLLVVYAAIPLGSWILAAGGNRG